MENRSWDILKQRAAALLEESNDFDVLTLSDAVTAVMAIDENRSGVAVTDPPTEEQWRGIYTPAPLAWIALVKAELNR